MALKKLIPVHIDGPDKTGLRSYHLSFVNLVRIYIRIWLLNKYVAIRTPFSLNHSKYWVYTCVKLQMVYFMSRSINSKNSSLHVTCSTRSHLTSPILQIPSLSFRSCPNYEFIIIKIINKKKKKKCFILSSMYYDFKYEYLHHY